MSRIGEGRIDLNADAGEGFDSDELFGAVSTVSVACGGHAGDAASMRAALERAKRSGVAAGAHPAYEDRENFGRKETGASARAIEALVERQVAALVDVAAELGLRLSHLKPHGALYHRVGNDPDAATALIGAVGRIDPGLALLAAPGSELISAATAAGLVAIREGFVDRRYGADGRLVPRAAGRRPPPSGFDHDDDEADSIGGFLLKGEAAVNQALALATGAAVGSGSSPFTGRGGAERRWSPIGETSPATWELAGSRPGSLCLHSDSSGAADLARTVRRALEGTGLVVGSFAAFERVPSVPEIHVVGAAIVEHGRVLLTRRGRGMSMPGKWEFPGGKVEPGESAQSALAREIGEELGVAVNVGERIGRGTSLEAGRRIVLEVYLARRGAGELRLVEHEELGWFAAGELSGLDWPEADLPILPALARLLDAAR